MTSPLNFERSDSLRPASTGATGLNAEYANMVRSTQQTPTERPQVLSADGTQLNIPPLSTESATTAASVTQTDSKTGKATTTQPTTDNAPASQSAPNEQLPQSVAYDPSLAVPAWQRFSQTPVATDGSMMPATGPGSPGDPGPGAAIPMWMRFAPQGMLNPQNTGDPNFYADTGQGAPTTATPDSSQPSSDSTTSTASTPSSSDSSTS